MRRGWSVWLGSVGPHRGPHLDGRRGKPSRCRRRPVWVQIVRYGAEMLIRNTMLVSVVVSVEIRFPSGAGRKAVLQNDLRRFCRPKEPSHSRTSRVSSSNARWPGGMQGLRDNKLGVPVGWQNMTQSQAASYLFVVIEKKTETAPWVRWGLRWGLWERRSDCRGQPLWRISDSLVNRPSKTCRGSVGGLRCAGTWPKGTLWCPGFSWHALQLEGQRKLSFAGANVS